MSAGDPEATDLSGASAKSGASADSDDDDGAARSPLRPLPARALPPLAALEHADALLNARPDAGARPACLPRWLCDSVSSQKKNRAAPGIMRATLLWRA